jgi:hypothetical protein
MVPLLLVTASFSVKAQSRDHLTQQEVDLIKDAQALDMRIDVFIKAAERRLVVITGVQPSETKQSKKEAEKWGELPKGTRADLIDDIAKILDEAITNIDDVSLHDEKNPLIAKAVRKLAAESTRLLEQLAPFRTQAKTEQEIGSLEQLWQNAQSILDAAKKLPPPSESGKGKDRKAKEKP